LRSASIGEVHAAKADSIVINTAAARFAHSDTRRMMGGRFSHAPHRCRCRYRNSKVSRSACRQVLKHPLHADIRWLGATDVAASVWATEPLKCRVGPTRLFTTCITALCLKFFK
jgi:hypothetical protein